MTNKEINILDHVNSYYPHLNIDEKVNYTYNNYDIGLSTLNEAREYFKMKIMSDKKHNGWTNYATWRVNLEIIDGYDWHEEYAPDADYVRELVEYAVFGNGPELKKDLLKNSFANAFLSEVNYYEIAENLINEAINEKEETQGK